jgi:ABC-type multidrug transport system fused ATPase/permease subunit
MDLITFFIYEFIKDKKIKILFIFFISLLINFLKINVISIISANIIQSIQKNNYDNTMKIFYFFIIIFILYILLNFIYKKLQINILSIFRYWLREELIKYILILNNENYSEINFTKLNSPIYRVSNTFFYVFNMIITTIVPNLTLMTIVFIYFFYKNYTIGIIFLLGNILLILYLYYNREKIYKYNEIYETKSVESENYIIEILNNIDKIIFRGNIDEEINNHKNIIKETTDSSIKFFSIANYHCLIMNIIIIITIIIVIFYLIKLYYNKLIDSTIFITFFTIILLYRDLILNTISQIPDLFEFLGKSNSVIELFSKMDNDSNKILSNIHKKYNNYELQFKKIEFKNVKFKYRESNDNVLNNFNLILDIDNKIIGIKGLSGNGKSTFAKLLIRLYNYDGNIYIDDINIKNIDTKLLRKKIIFVNQNSKLFDRKIIKNILYGCYDYDLPICYKQLENIMEYKKIKELFKNIDIDNKNAGSAGENLSGGQRQIINIINGLITPSDVIILDEPTNALDRELKKEIIQIIKSFKKYKKTIIIISHDNDIFNICDEQILI